MVNMGSIRFDDGKIIVIWGGSVPPQLYTQNTKEILMLKLNFSYSQKKDALTWVKQAKDVYPVFGISYKASVAPIPKKILTQILKNNDKKSVKIVLDYFNHNQRQSLREEFIQLKIKSLQKLWHNKGKKLIDRLEKIFGPFQNETVNAYITTLYICDYSYQERYFYLSLYHSLSLNFTVIAHELAHFLFYQNFHKSCQKLGLNENQLQDLKESTTVLLNTKEFNNILLIEDQGYEPHQKLRQLIFTNWNKERDFKKIINKIIQKLTCL